MTDVDAYRRDGFGIARQVFSEEDVSGLATECDRVKAESARYDRTFRHQNLVYVIRQDPVAGRILRFVQWPGYTNAVLARYRTDPGLLEIVEPLIGNDLKQIIHQIIWKPPETASSTYAFHQDARFRRPAEAYRDLANSYVQTAVAIDLHSRSNGCVQLIPGSHMQGVIEPRAHKSIMDGGFEESSLMDFGIDPADAVDVELDPGDVAYWHPFMLHGSGPNTSEIDRRSFVNGYVIADNCDRGEWAFRAGKPVELGEPALVQYDDLYAKPEPHYID